MDVTPEDKTTEFKENLNDGNDIGKGFEQMDMIYRSRCIQAPHGNNVIVREIKRRTDEKSGSDSP